MIQPGGADTHHFITADGDGRIRSPIGVQIVTDQAAARAAISSLRSVFAALETSEPLRETIADRFPDIFERCAASEGVELVMNGHEGLVIHSADLSAVGTNEILACTTPSKRHFELVAAIAAERKLEIIVSHGWPILSVGGVAVPTVTEAPAAGNGRRGGGDA